MPDAMKTALSIAPVAAKAQQTPQLPWFLTRVTAPRGTQLTVVGGSASWRAWSGAAAGSGAPSPDTPSPSAPASSSGCDSLDRGENRAAHSSGVRSEN
jgi:hypothetical protein